MESIQYHLSIEVCQTAEEAIQKGFIYSLPEYRPINIQKVVVVRDGTNKGNPTVDLSKTATKCTAKAGTARACTWSCRCQMNTRK